MAFVETRFPADIAYGSVGGPEYSTDIVITQGGYEQRNSNWSQARARFNVAHGIKTQAQLDELIAFFRARKGRADGFRFKDWTDFQAVDQLLGVADGEKTGFQLVKRYTSGTTYEIRTITKPVAGTVQVYINDNLQSTSSYSVNVTNGMISFATAPLSGAITADFEFDVPVRFDTDRLAATIESYGVHSWNDIPIIELKV